MKLNHVAKRKIIILLVIVLFCSAVWVLTLNTELARAGSEDAASVNSTIISVPEPVYIEVEKTVPVVTTIEVDRPVYIEKQVEVPHEVIREVPAALKDWDSPEQLAEFLKNDDTDQTIILQAGNSGEISFNGQCEDLALQLRDRAMAIGRYLSVQVLSPQEYEKWYGVTVGPDVYHAICMARIGNGFWYIEPSSDKQWRALYLD